MTDDKTDKIESLESKKLALHYIQTLVDIARESFLLLNADLKVISANPIFYAILLKFRQRKQWINLFMIWEMVNGISSN